MPNSTEEQEWRSLIERLHDGNSHEPPDSTAPAFDEASARNRVGLVITKAVLGADSYELYRLYCGNPPMPNR